MHVLTGHWGSVRSTIHRKQFYFSRRDLKSPQTVNGDEQLTGVTDEMCELRLSQLKRHQSSIYIVVAYAIWSTVTSDQGPRNSLWLRARHVVSLNFEQKAAGKNIVPSLEIFESLSDKNTPLYTLNVVENIEDDTYEDQIKPVQVKYRDGKKC
ncbi:hypothetical protein TNCV_868211 [Trichonephila clavipes]|nr:hypothetical protein TNCV_868211 [Trichonephila clavipes]